MKPKNDVEFMIKMKEIKGYQKFGRSGVHFKWNGSLENLMEYVNSRANERNTKKAFEVLRLTGQEKVLDFGAGRCWASHVLSKMGCDTVALDFNTDEIVGLKAGNTLVRNSAASFERVAGDCENVPFSDNSFDVVFAFQALHHAYNLNKMVAEAARVLRKGGTLIAVWDHKRGIFESEEKWRKRHSAVVFGINEHIPTYFAYINAFKKAGLSEVDMFYTAGWESLRESTENAKNLKSKFVNSFLKVRFGRCVLQSRLLRKLTLIFLTFDVTIVGRKCR